MASLQELYGDRYEQGFVEDNRQYVAGLLVSNIAGLNMREVKHDFSSLFDGGAEITEDWMTYIKSRIEKMNNFLIVDRIRDRTALPRVVPEKQITYLRIVDWHRKKIYIVFVTPYILDSF